MGATLRGGITQTGTSGSYTYSVKANMGNKPVNFVSWFDSARFANWLLRPPRFLYLYRSLPRFSSCS